MDDSTSILEPDQPDLVELTVGIASAYVAANSVPIGELPALLSGIHAAIAGLGSTPTSTEPELERPTAAKIRKSITHDALISFIDGKPYKTLKRHLSGHGLTIEQYRERYGLPRDYPSTAASYSAARSALAKSAGLGQQRRKAVPMVVETAATIAEEKAPGRRTAGASSEMPGKTRKPKKASAAE